MVDNVLWAFPQLEMAVMTKFEDIPHDLWFLFSGVTPMTYYIMAKIIFQT